MQVKLSSDPTIAEWSEMCVDKTICHVCETDSTCIVTENSNGDNPWVAICKSCCDTLFKIAQVE